MKVICPKCHKEQGEIDGQGVEGDSHVLCPKCLEVVQAEYRKFIEEANRCYPP